jgi:hypothetical protein
MKWNEEKFSEKPNWVSSEIRGFLAVDSQKYPVLLILL